jgi:hypothetical protein
MLSASENFAILFLQTVHISNKTSLDHHMQATIQQICNLY